MIDSTYLATLTIVSILVVIAMFFIFLFMIPLGERLGNWLFRKMEDRMIKNVEKKYSEKELEFMEAKLVLKEFGEKAVKRSFPKIATQVMEEVK